MPIKLSEIEELMVNKVKEHKNEEGYSFGFNDAIDQQSSRQIEAVIDREGLANIILRTLADYRNTPAAYLDRIEEAIVEQKETLIKIVHVKDK